LPEFAAMEAEDARKRLEPTMKLSPTLEMSFFIVSSLFWTDLRYYSLSKMASKEPKVPRGGFSSGLYGAALFSAMLLGLI
jgi:hypothetical protein